MAPLKQTMIQDLSPSVKYKKIGAMLKINSMIWKEVKSNHRAKVPRSIVVSIPCHHRLSRVNEPKDSADIKVMKHRTFFMKIMRNP